ncbi:hypothetical protein [Microbacterium enclense]|uniref:hypothetical protein n=1 Tax=Microbacterium enclense TaxID=993073 RepID=UPI000FE2FAC2|nr:hypothetical protein [Microbacterium enclense]
MPSTPSASSVPTAMLAAGTVVSTLPAGEAVPVSVHVRRCIPAASTYVTMRELFLSSSANA